MCRPELRCDERIALGKVRQRFNDELAGKKALIIGVNSSTEMLLSRLSALDVNLTVANRTLYSAEKIVRPYNASAISLEDFPTALKSAEMLFTVTSSPHYLVKTEYIESRDDKSMLVVVDLAVPRDVDPEVGKQPGVVLYDLDDLKHHLDSVHKERSSDLPYALELIEEQVKAYEFWRRNSVTGGNTAIRQILEQDRRDLLDKFKDGFRQGDQKALDAFSKNLYRQFLRRINNSNKK